MMDRRLIMLLVVTLVLVVIAGAIGVNITREFVMPIFGLGDFVISTYALAVLVGSGIGVGMVFGAVLVEVICFVLRR